MNLVIDVGNTLTKAAIYKEREQVAFFSFEKPDAASLRDAVLKNHEISNVLLSSVVDISPELVGLFSSKKLIQLNELTPLPVKIKYTTPETLGNDRLGAAVGAHAQFMGQNVLAIDAGTCIKYDLVNSAHEYLGGGISPGIDMRFKALHAYTAKLPHLNYQSIDYLVGKNSSESMLSGVLNGVEEEVKGIVTRYRETYPSLIVVFTGGYLKFFERIFNNLKGANDEKSTIFADPFLVLKGLNEILIYNRR